SLIAINRHASERHLASVNEDTRIVQAKRLLGNERFEILASYKFKDQALESFIYSTLSEKIRGHKKPDIMDLTNAVIDQANDAKLDPLFVLALIQHESHFNIEAKGSHGEIGLM